MPIYDLNCDACGRYDEDVFVALTDYDARGVPCACGAWAARIIAPILTCGPMPSKPLEVKQIGRSFSSNGELRQYMQENPNATVLSKDDAGWKRHRDGVREKAEKRAVGRGYQDFQDFKQQTAIERKKRAG